MALFVGNKAKRVNLKTDVSRKQSPTNFPNNEHFFPQIRTFVYYGVRNVRFLENLSGFVFLKHPFWDSPFCHITDVFLITWTVCRNGIMHSEEMLTQSQQRRVRCSSSLLLKRYFSFGLELVLPICSQCYIHPWKIQKTLRVCFVFREWRNIALELGKNGL